MKDKVFPETGNHPPRSEYASEAMHEVTAGHTPANLRQSVLAAHRWPSHSKGARGKFPAKSTAPPRLGGFQIFWALWGPVRLIAAGYRQNSNFGPVSGRRPLHAESTALHLRRVCLL